MIAIEDKLISDEIVEKQFVCDLSKCKGGCCEDGDTGAPITQEEANIIDDLYPKVKHLLLPKAVAIIEEDGTHAYDDEYGLVTPTIDNGLCVYGFYDDNGIIQCAFQHEYKAGNIDFPKPISCHLFPIRVTEYDTYSALNYEPRETLCKPACKLGKSLKMPVYQFLKEPLIRKYGNEFYETLDAVAKEYFNKDDK